MLLLLAAVPLHNLVELLVSQKQKQRLHRHRLDLAEANLPRAAGGAKSPLELHVLQMPQHWRMHAMHAPWA